MKREKVTNGYRHLGDEHQVTFWILSIFDVNKKIKKTFLTCVFPEENRLGYYTDYLFSGKVSVF